MKLSDKCSSIPLIGANILSIAKDILQDSKFRQVTELGGSKEIVALGDTAVENSVAKYLQEKNIPVNFDGEEKRQRRLCKNPLGKITLDPIDGTDNFVDNTLHYCTVVTIFDEPNPQTLGQAIWAGIYDHATGKLAHFNQGKVSFSDKTGHLNQRTKGVKSLKDLKQQEHLRLFLDLGPRETPEKLKPYEDILAKSWRKNVSCAGYHLMEVAYGSRDAYICPVQKPEELVAGIPLIRASGGEVLTFDGSKASRLPYDFDARYQIVAARTPKLARQLVHLIKD